MNGAAMSAAGVGMRPAEACGWAERWGWGSLGRRARARSGAEAHAGDARVRGLRLGLTGAFCR